jgi:hypothetical protein
MIINKDDLNAIRELFCAVVGGVVSLKDRDADEEGWCHRRNKGQGLGFCFAVVGAEHAMSSRYSFIGLFSPFTLRQSFIS